MRFHLHATSCRYGIISGTDEAERIEILFFTSGLLSGCGKNLEGSGEVQHFYIIKNENAD
tara:strand:- start:218 stop:397 length:180 start_codon:yes stop_codon:yes gene_type:complete